MIRGAASDPFFLVGADRSGTTLLRLMLNEHPRLHVPRESYFLTDLMNALPLRDALSDGQIEIAIRAILDQPHWRDWEIDDDALVAALRPLAGVELCRLIHAVFELSNDRRKPRWGDKTPRYVQEIARLHVVFPHARFVHLIRDGRDVCISLRNVGWHGQTSFEVAEYWARSVTAGIEQGRRLGPDLYLEMNYESLVLETESALRRVCGFLGEPYDPIMLNYASHAKRNIAAHELAYHTKVSRLPQESDVQRWKRELPVQQVALFEAYAGDVMDAVGQPRLFRGWMRAYLWFVHILTEFIRFTRPLRHRLGIRRRQRKVGASAHMT